MHAHSIGGIEYANIGDGLVDEAVCLSIVSSGIYVDNTGDGNVLIYTGKGRGTTSKYKQATDQMLVYLYDGLYTVQELWSEKGKVNVNAFKYKLGKIEGQPVAFAVWKTIERVSQTGLKVRLEVFMTKDGGWGLRSWDPLRAGASICEYAGEVIDKAKLVQQLDTREVNLCG
ncbi:hypothetical protein MLD38_011052 [Melastoma candidum]|uniref:Uncharacterized protein n=1 Tax=Melastoma candidum TaxID=119954 RepID=A0ACB9R1U6_9MYRT|nr:hypothetical protein MLD38_011052 [Melastoma candidum]